MNKNEWLRVIGSIVAGAGCMAIAVGIGDGGGGGFNSTFIILGTIPFMVGIAILVWAFLFNEPMK